MKRAKAIISVLMLVALGTLGSDFIYCSFSYCPKDDGALRAEALIGPAVVVLYLVYTILFVFAPSIWLSKHVGVFRSAAIASMVSALIFSWLIYVPKVDTPIRVLSVFLWLFLPWLVSVYIGNKLWPNKCVKNDA